ncbi:MAG: hypothetical protein AB7E47_16335 [Desulfovibrionaceae bacterium]
MAARLMLLDQALELGEQELTLLAAGRIDEAETLFKTRHRVVRQAFDAPDAEGLASFRDKLQQLQALQGRLTSEAQRLHDAIKGDLVRTRKETVRMAGYRKGAGKTPSYSRFISKHS